MTRAAARGLVPYRSACSNEPRLQPLGHRDERVRLQHHPVAVADRGSLRVADELDAIGTHDDWHGPPVPDLPFQ
jgi:hypothetical protein